MCFVLPIVGNRVPKREKTKPAFGLLAQSDLHLDTAFISAGISRKCRASLSPTEIREQREPRFGQSVIRVGGHFPDESVGEQGPCDFRGASAFGLGGPSAVTASRCRQPTRVFPMPKLTDTQLMLLSKATQQDVHTRRAGMAARRNGRAIVCPGDHARGAPSHQRRRHGRAARSAR
jgi:hypothetical protein